MTTLIIQDGDKRREINYSELSDDYIERRIEEYEAKHGKTFQGFYNVFYFTNNLHPSIGCPGRRLPAPYQHIRNPQHQQHDKNVAPAQEGDAESGT